MGKDVRAVSLHRLFLAPSSSRGCQQELNPLQARTLNFLELRKEVTTLHVGNSIKPQPQGDP